jgi:hypothetical protein
MTCRFSASVRRCFAPQEFCSTKLKKQRGLRDRKTVATKGNANIVAELEGLVA